jgi:hypothetical protein
MSCFVYTDLSYVPSDSQTQAYTRTILFGRDEQFTDVLTLPHGVYSSCSAALWLLAYTGWRRETIKFEIIRKKTKETYKTLFDPGNVSYKSGNFIRHHFLKITPVKCCPFCS